MYSNSAMDFDEPNCCIFLLRINIFCDKVTVDVQRHNWPLQLISFTFKRILPENVYNSTPYLF